MRHNYSRRKESRGIRSQGILGLKTEKAACGFRVIEIMRIFSTHTEKPQALFVKNWLHFSILSKFSSENVEISKRNNPKHPRRHRLPRANSLLQRSSTRYDLESLNRRRSSRPCRPIQSHRSRHPQGWNSYDDFPA